MVWENKSTFENVSILDMHFGHFLAGSLSTFYYFNCFSLVILLDWYSNMGKSCFMYINNFTSVCELGGLKSNTKMIYNKNKNNVLFQCV